MRKLWARSRKVDGHDITCRQVVALVTAYLDGTLPQDQHDLFAAHLAECENCSEYLNQIRVTIALSGRLTDEDLDPLARADLIDLYRRWRTDLHA